MEVSRIEKLLEFFKEDPQDPFNIYALATEYKKTDLNKARFFFEVLLKQHQNYTATYYHAAQLYIQIAEPELARMTFDNGLVICKKMNDRHALRELQNAFNEFLSED